MKLIVRQYGLTPIRQREDGYFDLTAMAQANGKRVNDYLRSKRTQAFLSALSAVAGIPATDLVQVIQGGTPEEQGTWGHPKVACHMAQWCSPAFEVQVAQWVDDLRTKGVAVDERRTVPPSGARALLAMVQQLVEIEDRQAASEIRIARIEARAEVAEVELRALPPAPTPAPEKSLRAALNERVRAWAVANGNAFQEAWRKLKRELYYRASFDAEARAKHSGKHWLDEVEAAGQMPTLYAIAAEVLA